MNAGIPPESTTKLLVVTPAVERATPLSSEEQSRSMRGSYEASHSTSVEEDDDDGSGGGGSGGSAVLPARDAAHTGVQKMPAKLTTASCGTCLRAGEGAHVCGLPPRVAINNADRTSKRRAPRGQ